MQALLWDFRVSASKCNLFLEVVLHFCLRFCLEGKWHNTLTHIHDTITLHIRLLVKKKVNKEEKTHSSFIDTDILYTVTATWRERGEDDSHCGQGKRDKEEGGKEERGACERTSSRGDRGRAGGRLASEDLRKRGTVSRVSVARAVASARVLDNNYFVAPHRNDPKKTNKLCCCCCMCL